MRVRQQQPPPAQVQGGVPRQGDGTQERRMLRRVPPRTLLYSRQHVTNAKQVLRRKLGWLGGDCCCLQRRMRGWVRCPLDTPSPTRVGRLTRDVLLCATWPGTTVRRGAPAAGRTSAVASSTCIVLRCTRVLLASNTGARHTSTGTTALRAPAPARPSPLGHTRTGPRLSTLAPLRRRARRATTARVTATAGAVQQAATARQRGSPLRPARTSTRATQCTLQVADLRVECLCVCPWPTFSLLQRRLRRWYVGCSASTTTARPNSRPVTCLMQATSVVSALPRSERPSAARAHAQPSQRRATARLAPTNASWCRSTTTPSATP